jgi:hypothetical protein
MNILEKLTSVQIANTDPVILKMLVEALDKTASEDKKNTKI